MIRLSSNVKQANFRLPLAYMDLIDEFSKREGITKAAVITRALDCMQASYDSGSGGMPVVGGGASNEELEEIKAKLAKAESKAEEAERNNDQASSRVSSAEQARDLAEARANDAIAARDSAEAKVRQLTAELETARSAASAAPPVSQSASDAELERLKQLMASQEKKFQEQLAAKDSEIASKNAAIAERDAKIASLSEQLGAANAKAELAMKNISVEAVTIGEPESSEEDPTRALAMLNMIGGVMSAFQQQVDDARAVGEQEGRTAVQKELQDMVEKARNDGYRDAMGYLDDRVTTARDNGAREERARIANMSFFERRRYLRMHIA